MEILIHIMGSGWSFLCKIDSRPNVGDRIYLDDLPEFKSLDIKLKDWIEEYTSFHVEDVVYAGVKSDLPEFSEGICKWKIQGVLKDH